MKLRNLLLCTSLLLAACGSADENNSTNNSTATNNGATNNGATNNGATNNGATNNGAPNNGTTQNLDDYISAEIDGVVLLADAAEGGIEPMDPVVQLRKTTGDTSPVKIYRLTVPAVEVATYDCSNPDVTVIYSELNGQLIDNWASSDSCTIEITAISPRVVGTFSATTSNGSTTRELTNGEFLLTP